MTDNQVIQKTRTVKEIFSVSLHFMSLNAKNLVIGACVFAMPMIVTGTLIAFLVTDNLRSFNNILFFKKSLDKNYFVLFLFAYAVYIFGICLFNLNVNKNMLRESDENGTQDFLGDFKRDLGEDLKNFVLSFIIVYLLYYAVNEALQYMPLNLIGGEYAADIQSYFGSVLGSLLLSSPIMFVVAAGFYFCFATLFVCFRDKLGVTEAIAKVWQYTRQKPAKVLIISFLLYITCYLVYNLAGIVVGQFEYWLFTTIGDIDSKLFIATYILRTFFLCLVALFYNIATVFLFGSLEDESEGLYIKSKIEKIDNNE